MAGCLLCMDLAAQSNLKTSVPCTRNEGKPCTSCQKLKHLEVKILEAKKALDDLLEQHREIKRDINRAHDLLISKVPAEVASLIFICCLPSVPPKGVLSLNREELAVPLRLGAVCHQWRKISWATPRLWSSISICFQPTANVCLHFSIFHEWWTRSGSVPLSIGIRASTPRDPKLSKEYQALLELVNQHSDRWYSLDIRIPSAEFSRFRGKTPGLRFLHLADTDKYGYGRASFNLHDIKPRPEELVLSNVYLKSVNVDYSRLTHLSVIQIEVNDFLKILEHAPQLKICQVNCVRRRATRSDILVHKQLQRLVLDCKKLFPPYFLLLVAFPALEVIECRNEFPATDIQDMLRITPCFLNKVVINTVELDQAELTSFLRTVPYLQHLEITVTSGTAQSPDALFCRLASVSNVNVQNPFLPALRSLMYHRPKSRKEFSWPLVAEFLNRHFESPHPRPLEKVDLSFYVKAWKPDPRTYIDRKTVPYFLAVLERGFDLRISTGTSDVELDFIRLSADYQDMIPKEESSDDDDPLLMGK